LAFETKNQLRNNGEILPGRVAPIFRQYGFDLGKYGSQQGFETSAPGTFDYAQ
jgi:hypothetical protein